MNIIDKEKPAGVIVQFGGQTPLNLARKLHDAGAPIIGTSVDSIERAGDRGEFFQMINKLGLHQPPNGMAKSNEEACRSRHADRLPGAHAAVVRARRPRHAHRV